MEKFDFDFKSSWATLMKTSGTGAVYKPTDRLFSQQVLIQSEEEP